MTNNDEQFEWLKRSHEKLQETVTQVRIDIEGLKVKSGVWGLIGGCVPVAMMLAYLILKESR